MKHLSLSRRHGFTLVELLVVVGIIGVLIGLLLPSLAGSRRAAQSVACKAQMRDLGVALRAYAESNRGQVFPYSAGQNVLADQRWPNLIFRLPKATSPTSLTQDASKWTPKSLVCPADTDPALQHSYVLNDHLADQRLKVSSRNLGGITSSDLILASEKIGTDPTYYVRDTETGVNAWSSDVSSATAYYRHGRSRGANYLHLDGSVTDTGSVSFLRAFNPWSYSSTVASKFPPSLPPAGPGGGGTTAPNTRP